MRSLWKFFKWFSAQKAVAQPGLRLPFGVGYYVCLNPTGDANKASPAVFWPRYWSPKILNIFLIWNRPNDKKNRKQKKAWHIYKILFLNIFNILSKKKFWIILWPKLVKSYIYLKTCCIVNDNNYIPENFLDKTLWNLFRVAII